MKRGRSVRRTHKYDIVNRDPPSAWCVERNGAAPFSKAYPLPSPSPPNTCPPLLTTLPGTYHHSSPT